MNSYQSLRMLFSRGCIRQASAATRRAPRTLARPEICQRHFSSVSSKEVGKFSAMDQDWWDARKNPLLPMNAVRVQYMKNQLGGRRDLKNLTALDIGCGGGLLSESLARLGAQVTGIDPSEQLVQAAQQHAQLDAKTRTIEYLGGKTIEQLIEETPERQFDVVCLLEVVEHATDVDSLLQASAAALKPDGLLFLSTMNRTLKSHLVTIVGAEYIMGYLPKGTHDWNKYLSPQQVQEKLKAYGLDQVDVTGMVVSSPPLFGKWDWKLDPNDTDVNWIGTYRKRVDS